MIVVIVAEFFLKCSGVSCYYFSVLYKISVYALKGKMNVLGLILQHKDHGYF